MLDSPEFRARVLFWAETLGEGDLSDEKLKCLEITRSFLSRNPVSIPNLSEMDQRGGHLSRHLGDLASL
jgi:hypothetical protein